MTGNLVRIIFIFFFILCLIQTTTVYADPCSDDCYAAYDSCTKKSEHGHESLCDKPLKQCIDSCPREAAPVVNKCRQKCDTRFSECVSRWKEGHEFLCDGPLSQCYAGCP